MSATFQRYQFTVDDFARMIKAGILAEDDRVELIDGEVRHMSPIGALHASIVNRLNAILTRQLGDTAIVSVQNPVILNDFTEPQPDFVVLRPRDDFYEKALPGPGDVLLVIEVSDSSLPYDRDEKAPRYAEMKIPEVWIVDVDDKEIVRYLDPHDREYRDVHAFTRGTEIASVHALPLRIAIDGLFRLAPSQ